MTDMVNGKSWFAAMTRQDRQALWLAVLDVIDTHKPTLIFAIVNKQQHVAKYGANAISGETYTYMLMVERFNHFLGRRKAIGMIISDDQKGSEDVVRKAHDRYRSFGTGFSKIDHVIETPFFAPSHWSRMIQIVDVATWFINRHLRNHAKGIPSFPGGERLTPHLDGHPDHVGWGWKVVP